MSVNSMFKVFSASLLIQKEISYYVEKKAVRLGLSVPELHALWLIASTPEAAMIDIAVMMNCKKAELQTVLESLQAEGLVTNICFCDSHRVAIAATEKGKALVGAIEKEEGLKYSFENIDCETLSNFVSAAQNLVVALRGYGFQANISADKYFLKTQRRNA